MAIEVFAAVLVALLSLVSSAQAWGSVGHEIIATIAQTQLHPSVREALCDILPRERTSYHSTYPRNEGLGQTHCHLAPLSPWPDIVKRYIPWSSHLHYVNPVDDEPPAHCTYGEHGWSDHGTGNVLEAIVNYTSQVKHAKGSDRDLALRFLTHYIGDLHQPLHLTGRARGGNDVAVRFEGRYAKLHTVWDSQLLNKQIRELSNYTTPLPSARIESALQGKTYDAYIRWILAEGLGQGRGVRDSPNEKWWTDEASWSECPDRQSKQQISSSGRARSIAPISTYMVQRIYTTIVSRAGFAASAWDPSIVDDTDLPVCPFAWSKPMHPLVCKYAFAPPVPDQDAHRGPLAELDVPKYTGRIEEDHLLQRQLAMGGMRLAAVLNTLLLPSSSLSESLSDTDPARKPAKHGGHHKDPSDRSPIWSLVTVTTESIAEVIILSAVGYLLARQGILDKTTQTKINKINVSFFTPSLLFSKVAFTLDPGRLAELFVVPAGFVIITCVSALAAWALAKVARITRAQRNFSIACAITPNSNSLPVALMQSLVATVPQLHWEEDGEPEDTVNGMLGRALTYLVLFSTFGMFLRWSLSAQLLSTLDEAEEQEEPVTGLPNIEPDTGDLIDYEGRSEEAGVSFRPSRQDIDSTERGTSPAGRGRHGPPAWVRSFPNSPGDSEDEDDEHESSPLMRNSRPRASQDRGLSTSRVYEAVMRPIRAIGRFMTIPLYAALLSLIVAMLPPVQKFVAGIEPLVGAIETAGACSIPLTMVVLGAYFFSEGENSQQPAPGHAAEPSTTTSGTASTDDTLVVPSARKPLHHQENGRRESSTSCAYIDPDGPGTESYPLLTESERRQAQHKIALERRTIAVAVVSRMILTPLILLPTVAWYAIATRYNVMDDPVFITCACLLIGSPPALTLAQITSQSAKGGDGSFERLISKTIFVSYAILATPTTIVLVLTALLVAENDH